MPSLLQVVLDTPLHRVFDYRLPDGLGRVQPGSLVEVPFGRTRQVGVALDQPADSPVGTDKLRDVIRVLNDRPALSSDILRLAQFCADYYHYPLGAILLAALPPRLRNATPFVADTPWLTVTAAGCTAEPPARARAQRALLDALRAAPQSRESLRTQKQGRHATALVAAGWAAWTRLPPPAGEQPQTATTHPPPGRRPMTSTVDRTAEPSLVEPSVDRWADLTPIRRGPRARVSAAVAARIFGRVTHRLGLDVSTDDDPGADLVLHLPEEFFTRLGSDGLIGFGESYMTGAWDAEDLGGTLTVLCEQIDGL
ncbi:MAG TPA: hypothetical protein VF501_07425, partial [Thiobacillus sp.]